VRTGSPASKIADIDALTDAAPGAGPTDTTARPVTADAVNRARHRLDAIALDLRWAWHPDARSLFRELDPDAWAASGHNPAWLLAHLADRRLATRLADPAYADRLERVTRDFTLVPDLGSWCARHHPTLTAGAVPGVALFSAEFALADCLPISAGGLGAVAGEHLKTSSELGLPAVGVGLLYGEASHQWLDRLGAQHETWEPLTTRDRPVTAARDRMRFALEVHTALPDGPVRARVWEARVGHSRLLLLDTVLAGSPPEHREITRRIYPSDPELRLRQYILLGLAGYRALVDLGLEPRVVHCNEGHTALAALARVAAVMDRHGLTFEEARIAAAPGIVFTTHTPVPAGHDYFPPALAEAHLRPVALRLGIDPDLLLGLGRYRPDDPTDAFCPTVLAMRLAGHRNGVSALHGAVTRRMWAGLWPRVPLDEVPVGHVTNGVHLPSWVAPETRAVLDRALGEALEGTGDTPMQWARVRDVPTRDLWAARTAQRHRLVERARAWLSMQQVRRGTPAVAGAEPTARLDPDALTIGFVGRFVAYKRPTLFLDDRERLRRILGDEERPVQIVFAGRAHPNDFNGKRLLRDVVSFARQAGLSHRLVFLEDFDIAMDHWLSQGVDVWLNTPRRPDEACGIAGMKAGISGALNFSTVDGWWDEVWREPAPGRTNDGVDGSAANPSIGWAIGSRAPFASVEEQDVVDAASLYDVLEHEIVPTFYDRDADGVPQRWVAMMRESMATLGDLWTSSRMLRDYTDEFYGPGALRAAQLGDRRALRARRMARHLARLREHWADVAVHSVRTGSAGAQVGVRTEVSLGELGPRDVTVEVWLDPPDGPAGPAPQPMTPLAPGALVTKPGRRLFEARLDPALVPPGTVVAARVIPRRGSLDDWASSGCIAWSE
jgi:starch phosphorylase